MPHPGSNASDDNSASIRMIRQKFDHCQILRWQEAYLFIPCFVLLISCDTSYNHRVDLHTFKKSTQKTDFIGKVKYIVK